MRGLFIVAICAMCFGLLVSAKANNEFQGVQMIFSTDIGGGLNTGVGLIRRGRTASDLLRRVLTMQHNNASHPLIRHYDHQGAIALLYDTEPAMRRRIALLDATLLNPFPTPNCESCSTSKGVLCWNLGANLDRKSTSMEVPCRSCHGYWMRGAWLVHFAGPNKYTACPQTWGSYMEPRKKGAIGKSDGRRWPSSQPAKKSLLYRLLSKRLSLLTGVWARH